MDRYVPELDGLRALAVLAVVAFHAGNGPFGGGYIGVDIFFVLSGYLITGILAGQYAARGRIAVWPFYLRRFFRLMPALLLLCLVYLVAAPFVWPEYGLANHVRDSLVSLAYLSDYGRAIWGVPEFLRHTWSLAVEEHFYLVWPLVLPFVLRSRRPARMALLLYLVAALWRTLNFLSVEWDLTYYRFDTRLAGILLGCWLALWLRERAASGSALPQIGPQLPALLLLVVSIALPWHHPLIYPMAAVGAEIATAALIVALVHPRKLEEVRLFRSAPAVFLGKLSYGIYLWHFPISLITRDTLPYWQSVAVCLTGATFCAWLSWHTVEAWGRRAKQQVSATTRTLAV